MATTTCDLTRKSLARAEVGRSRVLPGPEPSRVARRALLAAFVCQGILLFIAGYLCRATLDTDGVAYLRIAGYYATGQWDLAVSAYWSPLINLLITPFLVVGTPPLIAARLGMGLSALVYSYGCLAVLRVLRLPSIAVVFGTWLAALTSVFWSVRDITPDLLAAGLVCFGLSLWLAPAWTEKRGHALLTGMVFGVAYLAKTVALPMTVSLAAGLAVLQIWVGASRRRVLTQTGWTLLGAAIVAGPWVLLLSWHLGRPSIGTTGAINHALVGPTDTVRGHPTRLDYYAPPPGRLTTWEDPSELPYAYWSPFESASYFQHQLRVLGRNVEGLVTTLSSFDACYLGLPAAVLAFLLFLWAPATTGGGRWAWSLMILLCTSGVYLPVLVYPLRYHYSAYPFLLAACFGMASWLAARKLRWSRWLLPAGCTLVAGSFLVGHMLIFLEVLHKLDHLPPAASVPDQSWSAFWLALAERPLRHPAVKARQLAERLRSAGLAGPIAGEGHRDVPEFERIRADYIYEGPHDWDDSLFVAFFLDQPWHGTKSRATIADLEHSGARLIMIHRRQPLLTELDHHPAFRDLDPILFGSVSEAAQSPIKVYELNAITHSVPNG